MDEVLPDLEYKKSLEKWKEYFGYPTNKEFHLLARVSWREASITVSVYNGLPAPPFNICIGNEILKVCHVTGHILEVTRGEEESIPQDHSTGDKVTVLESSLL